MLKPHRTQTRNSKPLQTYNHSRQMSLFSDGLFYDSHKLVKGSTNFCPVFRNFKKKIFLEQKATQHIFLSRHFTPCFHKLSQTLCGVPSWLLFPTLLSTPSCSSCSIISPSSSLSFTYLLFVGELLLLMFIFTRWAHISSGCIQCCRTTGVYHHTQLKFVIRKHVLPIT